MMSTYEVLDILCNALFNAGMLLIALLTYIEMKNKDNE